MNKKEKESLIDKAHKDCVEFKISMKELITTVYKIRNLNSLEHELKKSIKNRSV